MVGVGVGGGGVGGVEGVFGWKEDMSGGLEEVMGVGEVGGRRRVGG